MTTKLRPKTMNMVKTLSKNLGKFTDTKNHDLMT